MEPLHPKGLLLILFSGALSFLILLACVHAVNTAPRIAAPQTTQPESPRIIERYPSVTTGPDETPAVAQTVDSSDAAELVHLLWLAGLLYALWRVVAGKRLVYGTWVLE